MLKSSTQSELVQVVFGALCGLPASESPLESNAHATFIHRLISHAIHLALQEQRHFEETLLAFIVWSYPDVPLRYDDFKYVMQRLLRRGLVEYRDGEYALVKEAE
jgi:hypothetical protein